MGGVFSWGALVTSALAGGEAGVGGAGAGAWCKMGLLSGSKAVTALLGVCVTEP